MESVEYDQHCELSLPDKGMYVLDEELIYELESSRSVSQNYCQLVAGGPYGFGVWATSLSRFAVMISGLSGIFQRQRQSSGTRSRSYNDELVARSRADLYHWRQQL
jgi:hypothetical protein